MIMFPVTEREFDELMGDSKSPVVLVFFHAPWCVSCKSMEPIIKELATVYYPNLLSVLSVDADASPSLAVRYNVSSLPYFLLFKDDKLVDQRAGVMTKRELEKLLEELL